MSVEAITWALKQPVENSSTKFVLVVLANCADGRSFECYPSIAYLCEATSQNRKTVIENIRRLGEKGYILDTGDRKGTTKSIKSYRLVVNGVPKTEPLSSTENGTTKQSQKRNSSENGTVPKTEPLSSTENGTVPKTVLLTSAENGTTKPISSIEAVPFSDVSSTENGHEAVPFSDKRPPIGGSQYVSEPSVNRQEKERAREARPTPSPKKSKIENPPHTFDTFVERRREAKRQLIDSDDPIFEWAENAGIPDDWLRLAWLEFAARYRGEAKRYADWPKVFRNAVRNNWFEFWRIGDQGQYLLTTKGEMARRAAEAKSRQTEPRSEVAA